MPVHPQVEPILATLAASDAPPTHEQTPEQTRVAYRTFHQIFPSDAEPSEIRTVQVEGAEGPLDARLYLPTGDRPHPLLVWFHGGGWVFGDLDTADPTARSLCVRGSIAVLTVDYRLAPEHPFPAAATDAIAAYDDVRGSSIEGVDTGRIAVGGDSAGGNLATVVAHHARDLGTPLRHQLLVYPTVDLTFRAASHVENAEGGILTAKTMAWFRDLYLGDDDDPTDPWASPLLANDHAGLAPATIITAELDPLRDEGESYAEVMRAAGCDVHLERYDGQPHLFFVMESMLDDAKHALDLAAGRLREALT